LARTLLQNAERSPPGSAVDPYADSPDSRERRSSPLMRASSSVSSRSPDPAERGKSPPPSFSGPPVPGASPSLCAWFSDHAVPRDLHAGQFESKTISVDDRYNCERCGEIYHEENLDTCTRCKRLVCPSCAGSIEVAGRRQWVCDSCSRPVAAKGVGSPRGKK
jgi:hypothetical protein